MKDDPDVEVRQLRHYLGNPYESAKPDGSGTIAEDAPEESPSELPKDGRTARGPAIMSIRDWLMAHVEQL